MGENHEMGSYRVSKSSEKIPQFESKEMVGVNQNGEEMEADSSPKHSKMQHLQSVLEPEGIDTHDPETSKMEESEVHVDIVETQSSQVIDKNAAENADKNKPSTFSAHHEVSVPVDLNTEMFTGENSGCDDYAVSLGDDVKHSSDVKGKGAYGYKHTNMSASHLDPNAEDVSSSENQDPCYGYRSYNDHLKMRDTLNCGRISVSKEEKDALRKWKEMKQNGFISPSYGGIPPAAPPPKQRGRKRKSDVLKQKIEQAKKEQVDKFTKIAAPSGLLNGLNPGIINHVRNSKQVHSIIQALVRSEKQESSKKLRQTGNTEKENLNEVVHLSSMPQSKLICENHLSYKRSFSLLGSGNTSGFRDLANEEGRFCAKTYFDPTHSRIKIEDDRFVFKPSSSNIVEESNICLSNNKSANVGSVDTPSVKAGTVASQWLHLLQQDIKGRLAALHRCKKRVCAVITTELPFLLVKEFSPNQENDPYKTAELHKAKWSKLFHQMDTTLDEEEKQLVDWLNQVNTMLVRCDEGLQHVQMNALFEMHTLGPFDQFRTKTNDPSKDLAVTAAAASIYSTSNFVSSRENVSCC